LKSALLSSVSHELRTPLTAIKTMLFSVEDTDLTREVRTEFVKSMNQEIDYLNRLVGNLLDMSRIEAGMLIPRRDWQMLEELLEGAVRRVGHALDGHPLHVAVNQDVPSLYVDGVEIQQVLINLLDNAAKYSSPESPITVRASCSQQQLLIEVENQADALSAEEVERMFTRFYRGRQRERTRGTGLGLAICKAIVEAHGGCIQATSRPDAMTISFSLPMTGWPSPHLSNEPAEQPVRSDTGVPDDSRRAHSHPR
jgi:two-component system sensor histidine kinase KdpD